MSRSLWNHPKVCTLLLEQEEGKIMVAPFNLASFWYVQGREFPWMTVKLWQEAHNKFAWSFVSLHSIFLPNFDTPVELSCCRYSRERSCQAAHRHGRNDNELVLSDLDLTWLLLLWDQDKDLISSEWKKIPLKSEEALGFQVTQVQKPWMENRMRLGCALQSC